MDKENIRKLLLIILAVCGWFALVTQFYLIHKNSERPFLDITINFFSFFTILTNLLVAVGVTMLLAHTRSKLTKNESLSAIAVYITIVGAVYNLVLRWLWQPQGLQKLTDELLHTAVPVLFVVFWIAFVPKDQLTWKSALVWLIYPLVYSIYTLIHGAITNWYPYPFIDPNKIGWNSVAINSVYVLIAFFVVSLIFIGIGKLRRR